MRVLVLANFGMGLYNFRKELLEKLINDKHQVFISLPEDEYVPRLMSLGCEFINTPVSRRGTNPITDLKLLLNYKKIITKIKPDLVLTYTIKPNVYGGLACRISDVPYLVNITGLGTAVENEGLMQKITLFLYKISMKNAKCVFFQNKENQRFLTNKKVIKGKYKILPGSGVNIDNYTLLDYPPNNNINFLFISRVMKEKGIDQYLATAAYIKRKYPNTNFHIVGFCEEEYEKTLKDMHEQGIIIYHGKQNDVRNYYKITHCTIHPSYYPEGMSNVLLESASSGRPIITTNRSGCKEVVENGINGYLVEPKNTDELIEKVEKFINLDYETKIQMGLYGRMKVVNEFDRNIVIDSYFEEMIRGEDK